MEPYSWPALRPKGFFKNLITITSETGVGSSTALTRFREHFKGNPHMRFISGGDIMRNFASSRGMTIEEFAEYCRLHPEEEWDKKCDEEMARQGLEDNAVIEGRLPHVFIPHAYHVRLRCDVEVRARRRWLDGGGLSLKSVTEAMMARDRDDHKRYQLLYPGYDWPDYHFHLVVDTATIEPDPAIEKILKCHADWLQRSREFIKSSPVPIP